MAPKLRALLLLPVVAGAAGSPDTAAQSPASLRGAAADAARAERCHTAFEGEKCFTAVVWAMQHGIELHPEWYPGLTASSSFEAFQGHLHGLNYDDCPMPCEPPLIVDDPSTTPPEGDSSICHTAVHGEKCFTAVTWAMEHGIELHPEWYPELKPSSSFEAFQQHLYSLSYDDCPMPCAPPVGTCHTAIEGERCFTAVTWAMQHGIELHPEWYPELKPRSSFEAFQQHLFRLAYDDCTMPCEPPNSVCHTAVTGETCFTAVTWAMQYGIELHPEWYPGLTPSSSFEAFQGHLHSLHHDDCPTPCAPADDNVATTTAPPTAAVTVASTTLDWTPPPTTTTTTTTTELQCALSIISWSLNLTDYSRTYFPTFSVSTDECKQADPSNDRVYMQASFQRPYDGYPWFSCYFLTLGTVSWYDNSECTGSATHTMRVFTEGDTTRFGCRDKMGNSLPDGSQCQGRWA